MFSASRWVVSDGNYRIEFSEPVSGALSIQHYYKVTGDVKSVSRDLELVSTGLYKYSIPKMNLLDSFKVFKNGTLLVEYDNGDASRDSISGDASSVGTVGENLPETEITQRVPEVYEWVYWSHADDIYRAINGGYYGRIPYVCQTTNIFPFYGEGRTIKPDYLYPLPNSHSPILISRRQVSALLEDAEELFEGDSGMVHVIEEEGVVVIPYSDGENTWKEEYDMGDYYESKQILRDRVQARPDQENPKDWHKWYVSSLPYWKKDAVFKRVSYPDERRGDDILQPWYYSPGNIFPNEPGDVLDGTDFSFRVGWDVFGADPAPVDENLVTGINRYLAWPSQAYAGFGGL